MLLFLHLLFIVQVLIVIITTFTVEGFYIFHILLNLHRYRVDVHVTIVKEHNGDQKHFWRNNLNRC